MSPLHRLKLPQVTLVAIEGRSTKFFTEMAHKALCFSSLGIDFGAVRLLSHNTPLALDPKITPIKINPLENAAEYNKFVFQDLYV